MTKPFKGTVNVDVRDSVADWSPFVGPTAPPESPNVVMIVWDDTGIGALDLFGGLIEMPNLKRIADRGLRYTNMHTTALCSPTRSTLLTGRNCHNNGMACIVEGSNGFPGVNGHIPLENGTFAESLLRGGWNTYCVGKWHLTPTDEQAMAASRRTWPTGRGFERFYGFLGAETNQWYPDLTQDNQYVDQPYAPEDGYHLSKDLTDRAIQMVADAKQVAPDKPFAMYLCYGANHAPHHAPKEWADRYKGRFDMGYERYREIVLDNQKKMGIVPKDTELSPMNPWPAPDVIPEMDVVLPWDSLADDQKKLFSRMAEVYAGFSSYTDHELGRLLDHLERSGQFDNTLFVFISDNGASGEGSPNGSVNENKLFNGYPDSLEENLKHLDDLGSPDTYNHYPTGWAWAFDTPYKMFKRYSLEGGIADPCIIAYPKEMKAVAGGVRDQYHHSIDIVPTVLDVCGIEPPETIDGHVQSPIQGVSMRYTFADDPAKSARTTQYYAMLGTRAIYHDGWKAVSRHGAISGIGNFDKDEWELYHVEADRSELHNLAGQHPDKLQQLVGLWWHEAGANNVLPLDDRTALEQLSIERPVMTAPRDTYVYFPGTAEVPESQAPNIRGRSYDVVAEVDVQAPDANGVLFAQGARFGGHSLFLKDGKAHYVYNFLGIEEQRFVSSDAVPAGKHTVGVGFTKEGQAKTGEFTGTLRLFVDGDAVAEGPMKAQPGFFSLCGEGLCVGRDGGDAVTKEYKPPFALSGAQVAQVEVNVSGEPYADLEKEAWGAFARD
jgi:arylsulfatase A-like enzyme